MTYYVLSRTLKPTHSPTDKLHVFVWGELCHCELVIVNRLYFSQSHRLMTSQHVDLMNLLTVKRIVVECLDLQDIQHQYFTVTH